MTKHKVLQQIRDSGIVPVIRADSAYEAQKIVESAYADGIRIFEITMTVPDAPELIKTLSEKYDDDVLIGAGTVLDVDSTRKCLKARAKFIVTPCLIEEIIKVCIKEQVLVLAGALTPSEIFRAWQLGADVIKIFPVSAMGGPNYIRSLKAPFPQIELMPTGGLKSADLTEFIEAGAIAIGVGFKA